MKRPERPALSLKRLIRYHVSLLMVLVFALFSLLTYAAERYTIRFSQDRRLRNIAMAVPPTVKDNDLRSINIKLTHGRDDFVLTIWNGTRQVYRSHEDVDLPRLTQPGFSAQDWHDERWTTFTRLAGPLTIQVAQSLDSRKALATERALHVIVPLILLLPLVILVVPFGVKRGLIPLTRMSQVLRERDWRLLEPISASTQGQSDVDELMPLAHALDVLLARLRQASLSQQAFIADASHELRTPLAALQLLVQMLDEAPGPAEREQALASLREGIVRATRLSDQLLVTSRLDAENPGSDHAQASLAGLVEEAIIALSPIATSRDIDLSLSTDRNTALLASSSEVSLLITNLIENAIRYTPRGGQVAIALATGPDGMVSLVVEDSGPGIAPEERLRVFDRFYRCPACDTPGSGLGLAIVAEVAARHKATVVLDDSRWGGLRATVRFSGLPLMVSAGVDGARLGIANLAASVLAN